MKNNKNVELKNIKRVCIIILTYNNVLDTIECINSVNCLKGGPYSVLIVDNASTDNTVEMIKEKFPGVNILQLNQNLGFSAGINEGIKWAYKRNFAYFFILNNDTVLGKDMMQMLLEVASAKGDRAMVMPRILFYLSTNSNERSGIWSDGGYLRKFPPSIKLKDDRKSIRFDIAREIDFAPFCGILVPKKVIASVGLLDTSFFFFYEDWDYCERVREKGFSIWCAPSAVMWHKVSKTIKKGSPQYWYVMGESAIKFFRRHYSTLISFGHISYIILRDFFVKMRNIKYLPSYLKGIIMGLFQPLDEIVYLEESPKLRKKNEFHRKQM
jgi:hypothetical protein